ncbi:hypothetical protein NDU88_009804 [Pleurodeles waltl]|uniref:Uncharacterized protein n=1 Tax=Pleurodeles waltl TaxID=8319 RepID=A0AAV7RXM6_PLEWA|nr:hypothetical protein NDU88_009804 [Pleurodeles waltl]
MQEPKRCYPHRSHVRVGATRRCGPQKDNGFIDPKRDIPEPKFPQLLCTTIRMGKPDACQPTLSFDGKYGAKTLEVEMPHEKLKMVMCSLYKHDERLQEVEQIIYYTEDQIKKESDMVNNMDKVLQIIAANRKGLVAHSRWSNDRIRGIPPTQVNSKNL